MQSIVCQASGNLLQTSPDDLNCSDSPNSEMTKIRMKELREVNLSMYNPKNFNLKKAIFPH
jgi:hypothetical protein